ncbi:MAG TPA: BON domain-containing protein [Vicinamibacterales bacterium]|nr:BON domain-containing protein [Vicinamibacterales bacterium]
MRQHTAPWLAAGLAALALAAGCTQKEPAETAEVRQKAGDAASAVGEAVSDGWITTKIQAKFFADEEVKARNIDVNTENGVVTLTGTVDNEQARQRAVEIARATDGVVRVEDRLTTTVAASGGAPPVGDRTRDEEHARTGMPTGAARTAERGIQQAGRTASNAWITTKIQAKYFADPIVKGRAIDVSTNNGVVTLTGEVENDPERQRALQLARETEGVKRVEDRLQIADPVSPPAETTGAAATTGATTEAGDPALAEQMSDAGITARVQSKFFLDDMVKGRNIDVTTSGGTVTLDGEVRNELERDQAIALARSVDGVRDVRSRLQVNPADATTARGTAAGALQTAEDTWITTKIQSRYFVDDLVKGAEIDVTTENGVVTLTGQVDSERARQRAEALARQTSGVRRVENKLTVGSETAAAPTTGSDFEPSPVP